MSKSMDIGLFVFRVTISAFMLFGHGLGKLNKLISGVEIKFFDPFGVGVTFSFVLAIASEFFAAALIIVGLFTRLSSLSLIITMFVAGFMYHADDPFGGKEKSLMYLVSYILLLITGPGKYSLQSYFEDKFKNKKGIWKFLLS